MKSLPAGCPGRYGLRGASPAAPRYAWHFAGPATSNRDPFAGVSHPARRLKSSTGKAPKLSRIGAAMQATEKSDSPAWIASPSDSAAAAARASTCLSVSLASVDEIHLVQRCIGSHEPRQSVAWHRADPIVCYRFSVPVIHICDTQDIEVTKATKTNH